MRSDRSLKRWYSLANKKFFYGELPQNVILRKVGPEEENDQAGTYETELKRYKYEIRFNREKNPTRTILLSALLHEMIHVATGLRDNHGPLFHEWHQKLMERGAFKKGALLKGISLF
jgi:hypothetical protein